MARLLPFQPDKTYIHVDTFARWRTTTPGPISSGCAMNEARNRG
jgi:hypothetical protein